MAHPLFQTLAGSSSGRYKFRHFLASRRRSRQIFRLELKIVMGLGASSFAAHLRACGTALRAAEAAQRTGDHVLLARVHGRRTFPVRTLSIGPVFFRAQSRLQPANFKQRTKPLLVLMGKSWDYQSPCNSTKPREACWESSCSSSPGESVDRTVAPQKSSGRYIASKSVF